MTLGEIQGMRASVTDVASALRSQQALLKMREMDLLPEVIDALTAVENDLYRFENILDNEETELEQLNALVQTSALVNSSLDLDNILNQAMDQIIELTNAGRGFILLKHDDNNELNIHVARSVEPEGEEEIPLNGDTPTNAFAALSNTIINEVMATGQPLLTDNAQTDPRLMGSETISKFVLRSVMCVPLIYRGQLNGAIYVDNRFRESVFTIRELNLLLAFANQTAVAIENALLFAQVQESLREITAITELTENVFASITSGVITTNADDVITTVNRAALNIFQRANEDTIGQPIQTLLPRLGNDSSLQNIREGDQRIDIDADPEVAGRGHVSLTMRLSPLKNAAQETQGVAIVIDDITEQRERDEVLQLMTRYLPPALVANIHQIAELALGGERREMTSVFVEVIPPYVVANELQPSEVMPMLNTYLETATTVINDAQGIIDKYLGTDVMILFNTQLNPQKNHAYAAVKMALDLRDAFVMLYARLGIMPEPHQYRIGINTGVATLGNVGSLNRRSFTAIGDTVNLAKRLQENAKAGQIIISEDTRRYIEAQGEAVGIRFEERDALQVKGRQQETRIFEVFRA